MAYVHHPGGLCQVVHLSPARDKFSRETNKFSLCQADALKNNLELIHLPAGRIVENVPKVRSHQI